MRIRPTVRLLTVDERQRLLLFRFEHEDPANPDSPGLLTYWLTPGGGVEDGETYEQAALRELWEETGIQASAVGPWVWSRERTLHFPDGPVHFYERYYWLPVNTTEVVSTFMTDEELQVYSGHHWWTLAEIEQSRDVILPPGLAGLIQPLLAGNFPVEPVMLKD